mmetsp:Transcript_7273/g.6793  ORF Transcript_7273/g.6793 Transcript_7273/m.6793 type:complete len:125 (-) Transcript_7273:155-529(-)
MRVPDLISPNEFWVDFANYIVEKNKITGFLSSNFIYATSNITEVIAMISILDLPFEEELHTITSFGDKGVRIKAANNLMMFKKEIKEAEADIGTDLMSIHRFYEYNNPKSKKTIKEFLTHKVYT